MAILNRFYSLGCHINTSLGFALLLIATVIAGASQPDIQCQPGCVAITPMVRPAEFCALEPHLGFVATGFSRIADQGELYARKRSIKCGVVVTSEGKVLSETWSNAIVVSADSHSSGWASVTGRIAGADGPDELEFMVAVGVNDAVVKTSKVRVQGSVESQQTLTTFAGSNDMEVTIWKCRCRSALSETDATSRPVVVSVNVVVADVNDDLD